MTLSRSKIKKGFKRKHLFSVRLNAEDQRNRFFATPRLLLCLTNNLRGREVPLLRWSYCSSLPRDPLLVRPHCSQGYRRSWFPTDHPLGSVFICFDCKASHIYCQHSHVDSYYTLSKKERNNNLVLNVNHSCMSPLLPSKCCTLLKCIKCVVVALL